MLHASGKNHKVIDSLSENLLKHVQILSSHIGERNYLKFEKLTSCANYIEEVLRSYGYKLEIQKFSYLGQEFKNIIVEHRNFKESLEIIIGAHYDTVEGCPGADDNASGVACLLELANLLKDEKIDYKVNFAFFTNEEPPFFGTSWMGSYIYAQTLKRTRRKICGMISLESIGYFRTEKGSQSYPPGIGFFYPKQGNFIAIVGNIASRKFGKKIFNLIKEMSLIPVESLFISPFFIPEISFSDNFSFWQFGFPAVMVTDTAFLRNPNYHLSTDIYQSLNYEKLACLTYSFYYILTHFT